MSFVLKDNSSRQLVGIACFIVPLGFGLLAAFGLQQDANWDLRNYHWYNPYAYLGERWGNDIMPAQTPTFYNPILDTPFFLMAQNWPARAFGFAVGCIQGLNFALLYLIAASLFKPMALAQRRITALIIALVGVVGGGNLGLIGTTFHDNVVSLFVLGAIAVVLGQLPSRPYRRQDDRNWLYLLLGGVLVGFGAGLKLPTAVYAVGLCAALLISAPGLTVGLYRSFVFGIGTLAGLTATAGQWMWFLWANFGNPIFPYFNTFFKSDMGVSESYRDTRFIPEGVLEWAFFPFVIAHNPMQTGETDFRDWRLAVTLSVLLLTSLIVLFRRKQQHKDVAVNHNNARFLILTCAFTYVVWLALFAIYRYAIVLEMLAPLVAVAAIASWPFSIVMRAWLATSVLLVVTLTAIPGNWGRVAWGSTFIETQVPHIPNPDKAMVLMFGTEPTSWVIPAFPPAISFVRIQGYGISADERDTGLYRRIQTRIADHHGDFLTLATRDSRALAEPLLAQVGLRLAEQPCLPITSNLAADLELCPVIKKDSLP